MLCNFPFQKYREVAFPGRKVWLDSRVAKNLPSFISLGGRVGDIKRVLTASPRPLPKRIPQSCIVFKKY
jgi:hypothetical protein